MPSPTGWRNHENSRASLRPHTSEAKREEIEREFPIEKAVAMKKITRLDALKARVVDATKVFHSQVLGNVVHERAALDLRDIECLVAVVEAYLSDKVDSTDPGYPRTDAALAYWLEEEQQ